MSPNNPISPRTQPTLVDADPEETAPGNPAAEGSTTLHPPEENPEPATGTATRLFPRIAIEGGLVWTDLENGRDFLSDHGGGYGRAEGGVEYFVGSDVFIQGNLGLTYGRLGMNLGEGVDSNHDYFGIMANGRLGISLFDENLRLHAGVDFGAVHVGAEECEDGLSCGAVFSRNAQLFPIDNWGVLVGPEVGISTLRGGLSLIARLGWMAGINPDFDVVDSAGDEPSIGLNPSYFQIGIQAEILSLIRFFSASDSSDSTDETEETEASEIAAQGTERDSEAGEAAESEPPVPETAPTGIALIRQRQTEAEELASQVTQAGILVTTARAAYRAVTGTTTEANRDRRVQVLEAINQARTAVQAVSRLGDLLEEARAAQRLLTGEERVEARRIVRHLERQRVEARAAAGRLYREVQTLVREFNERDPGENVALDFPDPSPRRAAHPHPSSPPAHPEQSPQREPEPRQPNPPQSGGGGDPEAGE